MNNKQVKEFIHKMQDPNNQPICVAEPPLRLFVWYHILNQYSDGLAFAMAHSVEEARDVIAKSYLKSYENLNPKETLYEIYQQQPIIFDTPYGDFIFGGD